MFINYSHHPSEKWSSKQFEEAKKYGEITDIPFAYVPPRATSQEVYEIAKEQAELIASKNPDAVLCQGEMTMCFYLVTMLKQKGIKVLCACTERVAEETFDGEKTVVRSSFEFVQFREY